jgi:hypothetical protein
VFAKNLKTQHGKAWDKERAGAEVSEVRIASIQRFFAEDV